MMIRPLLPATHKLPRGDTDIINPRPILLMSNSSIYCSSSINKSLVSYKSSETSSRAILFSYKTKPLAFSFLDSFSIRVSYSFLME